MGNNRTHEDPKETLQNVLTEDELKKLLGLTKGQLAELRLNEQMPFLKINRTSRLYLESDLMDWLRGRKVVYDKNE